jgi:hypothetical protein
LFQVIGERGIVHRKPTLVVYTASKWCGHDVGNFLKWQCYSHLQRGATGMKAN